MESLEDILRLKADPPLAAECAKAEEAFQGGELFLGSPPTRRNTSINACMIQASTSSAALDTATTAAMSKAQRNPSTLQIHLIFCHYITAGPPLGDQRFGRQSLQDTKSNTVIYITLRRVRTYCEERVK